MVIFAAQIIKDMKHNKLSILFLLLWCSLAPLCAQGPVVLQGLVTDKEGEPLIGATVRHSGGRLATITDADGHYSLKVPPKTEGTSLIFSYVGMKTQTIAIGDRRVIDVTLQTDAHMIQDVVVEGAYGTAQKRSDQVGSAFQVTSKELEVLPQDRLDKMLEGLVPGVQVTFNSDSPGNVRQRYNIRVRGEASLSASNEPLWVVDGTPIYTGEHTNLIPGMSYTISPLSFLDPADIASITVLKDASATSIYGADGANGVILVTTRQGKVGATRLDVNLRYGVATIDRTTAPKVLNGGQYLALAKEAWSNAGMDMKYFPFNDNAMNQYSTTDTDWLDVFYDKGQTLQANVTASGGSQGGKYYISAAYYENASTVSGNNVQRFSLHSNNELKFGKRFTATMGLQASYNVNDLFVLGRDYFEYLPILAPYNADGTPTQYYTVTDGANDDGTPHLVTNKFLNSVAERDENIFTQKNFYLNANFKLKYEILKGLTYTGQFGIDMQAAREEQYSAMSNWSGISNGEGVGYSTRNTNTITYWTTIHRLNYNHDFDKWHVDALGGFEASSKDYTYVAANGWGFINDKIQDVTYAEERRGSNSSSTTRKVSFLAQGSLSYDKRYYLVFNGRRDGNSQFGSDVRWGNFGSTGLSWNIHNESWFSYDPIDVLKLKFSYGINGNSRLGSQEALGLYSYGSSYMYAGQMGGVMSGCPNSKLSWETTHMTNYGLRVELLHRFDFELEGYHNVTKNLLSNLDVSRTTGDTRAYRNVGEISNTGVELTITTHNIVSDKEDGFTWNSQLNLSHNTNKLLKLYNGIQKNFTNTAWIEGYDINTYYLVRWAGVDPRDGAPRWLDKEGNVTRTYTTDNRVPHKSSSPIVAGALTNDWRWKGVSLHAMLNYTIGGYAFSSFARAANSDGLNIASENQSIDQLNRWQKSGDLAMNPKPIWGVSTQSVMNSTRFVYDKTNFRLQNITLSYQLPKSWSQKMSMRSTSLSLMCDNLAMWVPYKTDVNSYKTAISGYPLERTFTLSINANF